MVRAAGSPGNPPGAGSRTSVSIQRHLQLRCRSHAAVPRHMGRYRRPPSPREPVLPGAPPRRNRGAVAGQLHRPGKRSRPCVGRGRACTDPAPRHPNWPPRSPPFTTSAARRTGCASGASATAEHERRSVWMWPLFRAEQQSVPAIDRGIPTSAHATVPQVAALVGLVDVSNSRIKDMCHTSKAAMVHPARLFGHIGYEHCRNSLLASAEMGLLLGAGSVGAARLGTWAWTRRSTGRTGPGWSRG
jgi:hypothetical protein